MEFCVIERYKNYSVSKDGKVMNNSTGKVIATNIHRRGYLYVTLWHDGKSKKEYVHRLVAETYLPNPNGFPVVNHKDEDKKNNNVSNLEWCTYKYNTNYGNAIEKMNVMKKKIPVKCIETGIIYESLAQARRNGFHPYHVRLCCEGVEKTHKKYHWEFV